MVRTGNFIFGLWTLSYRIFCVFSQSDNWPMKLLLLILCLLGETAVDVLTVAKTFLGVPYVAGTLEHKGEERLVINEKELDCTTFVELSVARWIAAQSDSTSFEHEVQHLRYRGGEVNGYLSRLHYFTDWVAENEKRSVWHELEPAEGELVWRCDTLNLSFMSEHPQSYPYLKENAWAVDSIRSIEAQYADRATYYIGKEYLNLPPERLPIQDGDILALVTTIKGLDVTHLGFAVWQGEKLNLMHASMTHKRVVIDERTLYDYLQTRTSCPGVRVVRLLP